MLQWKGLDNLSACIWNLFVDRKIQGIYRYVASDSVPRNYFVIANKVEFFQFYIDRYYPGPFFISSCNSQSNGHVRIDKIPPRNRKKSKVLQHVAPIARPIVFSGFQRPHGFPLDDFRFQ